MGRRSLVQGRTIASNDGGESSSSYSSSSSMSSKWLWSLVSVVPPQAINDSTVVWEEIPVSGIYCASITILPDDALLPNQSANIPNASSSSLAQPVNITNNTNEDEDEDDDELYSKNSTIDLLLGRVRSGQLVQIREKLLPWQLSHQAWPILKDKDGNSHSVYLPYGYRSLLSPPDDLLPEQVRINSAVSQLRITRMGANNCFMFFCFFLDSRKSKSLKQLWPDYWRC